MDIIRKVEASRQSKGLIDKPMQSAATHGGKKMTKAQRAKEHEAGSRSMRHFIIEEKPSKKVVVEHFEALIAQECQSSSDEE